jgi:hypothetical protein
MNELVNFEIAKLLKEKGFDIAVRKYYLLEDRVKWPYEGFLSNYWGDCRIMDWNKDIIGIKPFKGFISAPTIAEAVMWCYEEYGVWVSCDATVNLWFYSISTPETGKMLVSTSDNHFNSPAEAYEAAITYCLETLVGRTEVQL